LIAGERPDPIISSSDRWGSILLTLYEPTGAVLLFMLVNSQPPSQLRSWRGSHIAAGGEDEGICRQFPMLGPASRVGVWRDVQGAVTRSAQDAVVPDIGEQGLSELQETLHFDGPWRGVGGM